MTTVLDAVTPPGICRLDRVVKPEHSTGWLMGMSSRNVMVVGAEPVAPPQESDEESGRVVRLTLMETDGISCRSSLRLAKPCRSARLTCGETAGSELELNPDGVAVDFSPWQMVTLELTF